MLLSAPSVLPAVADKSSGFTDTIHHVVACINTLGAVDAFQLQSVSDIDPGGADDNTSAAVVAISCCVSLAAFTLAPWFAAVGIVGDNETVVVQHPSGMAGVLGRVCRLVVGLHHTGAFAERLVLFSGRFAVTGPLHPPF